MRSTQSILLEHRGYYTIPGYVVIWVENMARSVVSTTRLRHRHRHHARLLLLQVLLVMVGNGPVGDACYGTAGAECHLSRTAHRRTSAKPRGTPRVTIGLQLSPVHVSTGGSKRRRTSCLPFLAMPQTFQ